MSTKKLNTTIDFELADGTTVKLTLAFYMIYQLKAKDKSLYERYNKAMVKVSSNDHKNFDELESITILYTAYVCANLNDENRMSEEEFMILCGSDRIAVNEALTKLVNPKNS